MKTYRVLPIKVTDAEALEYAAKARLLGLWFDRYTHTFRPRSPEGSKYKYSECLDVRTMEPFYPGGVLARERKAKVKNSVSNYRLGYGKG